MFRASGWHHQGLCLAPPCTKGGLDPSVRVARKLSCQTNGPTAKQWHRLERVLSLNKVVEWPGRRWCSNISRQAPNPRTLQAAPNYDSLDPGARLSYPQLGTPCVRSKSENRQAIQGSSLSSHAVLMTACMRARSAENQEFPSKGHAPL